MRKIKEMLRLHFEQGISNREIARSLSVSHSTVNDLLGRFQAAGLCWPLPRDLDEPALEAELYSGNTGKSRRRPQPDWDQVYRELSRKGVTVQLLWLEYKDRHPDGYQYSQFCEGKSPSSWPPWGPPATPMLR
jgi:transposase